PLFTLPSLLKRPMISLYLCSASISQTPLPQNFRSHPQYNTQTHKTQRGLWGNIAQIHTFAIVHSHKNTINHLKTHTNAAIIKSQRNRSPLCAMNKDLRSDSKDGTDEVIRYKKEMDLFRHPDAGSRHDL